jgi:DNA-binding MarR family transcriptional regulator
MAQARQATMFGQFEDGRMVGRMARRVDPETSRAAAAWMVRSGHLNAQAALVLEALRRFPGSTTAELARRLAIDRHIPARRMRELVRAGRVVRCEKRKCQVKGTLAYTYRLASL